MAIATMTMLEAYDHLGGRLFAPLPFYDYETLQQKILDQYSAREIAFDTPEYFRVKLNHYLRLRVGNYNKMLQSELMEIDPFVTDYMVTTGTSDTTTKTKSARDVGTKEKTNVGSEKNSTKTEVGNSNTDNTFEHDEQTTKTSVKGSLYSEAKNTSQDETSKTTETMSEAQDVTEEETTDTTGKKDKTSDTTKSDNQTDRKWTETGSSQAHNLNVGSDTPQAMLFNEPNHYYGTGRAHDYGIVKTDAEGNQYYEHYPETEPSQIDTGSYQIGGGNTPWFNYASTAANQTGHDSYDKSGTETYARGSTENQTDNEESSENKDRNLTGTKDTDRDTTTDTTRNLEEGVSTNANEHSKQDDTGAEYYTEKGNTNTDTTKDTESKDTATSTTTFESKEKTKSTSGMDVSNKTGEVKKGRMMRSPSELLKQYRETLTFNADMWLLSELEPLFLGVF